MYGLNRLNSAKNLRALFTAAAAAPSPVRLHRLHSSCRSDIDDFVCVGKGYKICGMDEIEGSKISEAYKRKMLPPQLMSSTVVKLTCESAAEGGICDVYLVGTNHTCEKTWREAHTVIKFLKPQVVFLELCSTRMCLLTRQPDKVLTMGEMFEMWKKNEDPFSILYKWFRTKLANREETKSVPGGEFRVAYEEAMKYGGKVILGDIPCETMTRRILAKASAWEYLFVPLCVSVTQGYFERDVLDLANQVVQELSKKYPIYWEPIVHERDQYMSAKILKVAREHNCVVAVVGIGHLRGIQKHWKQPVDMKELLDAPTFTIGKTLSTFGAMVVYSFLSNSQICKIREILTK